MIDQIRSNILHMVQMTNGVTHSAPPITTTGVKIHTDRQINLRHEFNVDLTVDRN